VVGPQLQKIVVGGPTYGHHTLTRFYALHTAVLPPLVIVFIILHLMVFRRHGVTHGVPPGEDGEPLPSPKDSWFWPEQAFRDLLVSMLIFAVMIGLVLWGFGQKIDAPSPREAKRKRRVSMSAGRTPGERAKAPIWMRPPIRRGRTRPGRSGTSSFFSSF
jgi:ubiquinol-cytochrome c reductase cytochrome b subunit